MVRVFCQLTLSCTRFELDCLGHDPRGSMLYFPCVNWSFYFSDDGCSGFSDLSSKVLLY